MKHIRMTNSQADAWLGALRSGEYKQGRFSLNYKDLDGAESYCCLGVLEKVVSGSCEKGALPSSKWLEQNEIVFLGANGSQYDNSLLQTDNTRLQAPWIPSHNLHLSVLNDAGELNFSQIADVIESELEIIPEPVTVTQMVLQP